MKTSLHLIPVICLFLLSWPGVSAQPVPTPLRRSLSDYLETAQQRSPLLADYRNRTKMAGEELQRLKALYTRAHLEVTGDYLFVPIVSLDGGRTSFKWNAQSATDYYGYDLGQSSGSLQAGVTLTRPLLGRSDYRLARRQYDLESDRMDYQMRMAAHELRRTVTEQYLLCLLDRAGQAYADSVTALLDRRIRLTRRLVRGGQARQSDLRLLDIERTATAADRLTAVQSYRSHLADLNLLCGMTDTSDVVLSDSVSLAEPSLRAVVPSSLFVEQYRHDSLDVDQTLRVARQQYRPRLDFFANSGLQVGDYHRWFQHFGWSAGLTFRWTIYDGRQQRHRLNRAQWQQVTIDGYRDRADLTRRTRLRQCRDELRSVDRRRTMLDSQMVGYDGVLREYERQVNAGQVSVMDYLTLLRQRVQAAHDRMVLQTNRLLVLAACEYWSK